MSLDEMYSPLKPEEMVGAGEPKKPAVEKVPIIPVPDDAPACTFKIPKRGGAPKMMWAYRDAEGRLLGYDARFEFLEDGKPCKEVMPVTYCQVGPTASWRSKAMPAPRSIYGLDRLAARPNAPVVVAEGCKSADAAATLLPDHVAVSWSGGGKAVNLTNWKSLAGRDVLIWPDRDRQSEVDGKEKPYEDQPGTITAQAIVDRIKGVAKSVRILDLETWDCEGGWDAADAVAEGWTPEQATELVAERATLIDQDAPGTVMPFGFQNEAEGLFYVNDDTRMHLAGRIKVIAKTRDPSGASWGRLLEWRDHDGRLQRWAMPMSMLSGDGSAIREALLDRGTFVTTEPRGRSKLLEFLVKVDTDVRARAVSKVGWSGSAFALPELTIGDSPVDRVIFQQPDAAVHHYQSQGTLEEWQHHVARLAIGNSRLLFMMSTAFVGPVLLPAVEEGGGFNVVGSSSTGKSTGLRAGASVWGPPPFIRQWRATSNGLEGVATQHNETLLCLDELSQVDPREAGPIAYMLGNGQGKSRASRAGGGRAAATWKLIYLSTGEVGLAEIMREGKQGRAPMAGQEVRILDVPADAGKGMGLFEQLHGAVSAEAFSRQISTAAATYYGTASIDFLNQLTGIGQAEVGSMIAATIAEFVEEHTPIGADGQVQRAARRFGLVAAAGELAVALGVLPWPPFAAYHACGVMLRAWIERRGGTGSAEERNVLSAVRGFLEAHGASRFSPIDLNDDEDRRTVINRVGFWRMMTNEVGENAREHLILPGAFRDEVCRGFDPKIATAILHREGGLRKGPDDKFSIKVRLPGMGSQRVYIIGPEIFDAG